MPRNLGDLIGAIDQGTSSTRFLVFQVSTGDLITSHQIEVPNIYPQVMYDIPLNNPRIVYE